MIQTEIFICSCYSTEHQMVFKYDPDLRNDPNYAFPYVYVDFHLVNYGGFWKRVKYAWKYIWGYKSRFGAFDELFLDSEDIPKFEKILEYLNMIKETEENRKKKLLEKNKEIEAKNLLSNPDVVL